MERKKQRHLSVAVGVFLLVVSGAVVALMRGTLFDRPVLAFQVGAVGIAGILDIVSGFDTRITEHVAWYKIAGLGNIFLAVSLPLGFVDPVRTLPLVVGLLGVVLFGAMGIDMLLFDGRYVYSESLSETEG